MEFLASGKLKDRKLAKEVFKALDTNGDGELVIPEYPRVGANGQTLTFRRLSI